MHWWLLRSHSESEASYEDLVARLSKQLNEGKDSLWQDHKHVSDIMNGNVPVSKSNENSDPQQHKSQSSSKAVVADEKATTSTDMSCDTIRIDILGGEYQGSTFELAPKKNLYAWVGRSQGKKFREKGISLPKDLEVSTTHGRFELRHGNKFVYVDTGSTNGSRVGGLEIEADQPIALETGMEITVGQTVMKITVPF